MGLLALAGALSGAGQGAAQALQTGQAFMSNKQLQDERMKWEGERDARAQEFQTGLNQQQMGGHLTAVGIQEAGAERRHKENLRAQSNLALDKQAAETQAAQDQADEARRLAIIKSANERQEITSTETGADNKLYGVTKGGEAIDLGISAKTVPAKLKETTVDTDGKLVGIMEDGTVKDLQRTVPRTDKVIETFADKSGNLWAITESGQKTNLGIQAPPGKTDQPTVYSIETDNKSGQQYAIMKDGSKKSLGITGGLAASTTKDLPESTKQTVMFLEKRIASLEKLASDPMADPKDAQRYHQQITDLSQQAMDLLGHGTNPSTASPPDPNKVKVNPFSTVAPAQAKASHEVAPEPISPLTTPGLIDVRKKPTPRGTITVPAPDASEVAPFLK